MTNSKSTNDKSTIAKEISEKNDFDKLKTNKDEVPNLKEKCKSHANVTNRQDLKKAVYKNEPPKTIRNKQRANVNEQKIPRNNPKTLNKTQCLNESPKMTKLQNRNSTNSDQKLNTISTNHSITRYFSTLGLAEIALSFDEESEKNLEQFKSNRCDIRNLQQSSHTNLGNVKKALGTTTKKKSESENHKLTEYFPVRRSDRKFKKHVDIEKQKDLEKKIKNEIEDGLKIKEFDEKGRGVITTREFNKGDFVIEYIGDLIDGVTAKKREMQYAKNENIGCYMYYFKHKDRQYCIDATKETKKLGRLINHSRKGNLISRIVEVSQVPHLVLFAKADIPVGTELLYDYGDRNQESIKNHPWLNL